MLNAIRYWFSEKCLKCEKTTWFWKVDYGLCTRCNARTCQKCQYAENVTDNSNFIKCGLLSDDQNIIKTKRSTCSHFSALVHPSSRRKPL